MRWRRRLSDGHGEGSVNVTRLYDVQQKVSHWAGSGKTKPQTGTKRRKMTILIDIWDNYYASCTLHKVKPLKSTGLTLFSLTPPKPWIDRLFEAPHHFSSYCLSHWVTWISFTSGPRQTAGRLTLRRQTVEIADYTGHYLTSAFVIHLPRNNREKKCGK